MSNLSEDSIVTNDKTWLTSLPSWQVVGYQFYDAENKKVVVGTSLTTGDNRYYDRGHWIYLRLSWEYEIQRRIAESLAIDNNVYFETRRIYEDNAHQKETTLRWCFVSKEVNEKESRKEIERLSILSRELDIRINSVYEKFVNTTCKDKEER